MTVFRDELINLLYGDEDAKRLSSQSFILSEFLHDHVNGYEPPRLNGKRSCTAIAITSPCCTSKREVALLKNAGVECDVPDSGCCGMAGSFGYEADHYEVGLAAGERVLLPAVRETPRDELIVTDGFSCREMIRQETDRRAVHFAQVLQMAIHEGPAGPSGALPEARYTAIERTPAVPFAVIAAAGAIGAGVWWAANRRRDRNAHVLCQAET